MEVNTYLNKITCHNNEENRLQLFNTFKRSKEIEDIYDYPTIEFEKVFTIIQGKIQSSKTNKDENGTLLLTGAKYSNMFNIIETDTSHSYVEGNNVFMCCGGNGDSVPIRYYEGKCFYSCLMGLCKITTEYENKINHQKYN